MSLPAGFRRYPAVILPVEPEAEGVLPFGQTVDAPVSDDTSTDISAPGGQGGLTVLLDGTGRRVLPYQARNDGASLPGQIGPYAVVIAATIDHTAATVVLPADVARFLAANSPLESAAALLDTLLERIDTWSVDGSLLCSRITGAIARIIAGYQAGVASSSSMTVDLHIYLALLKSQFQSATRLFGGRAQEATGTSFPLVQVGALSAINAVLGADGNAHVAVPDAGFVSGLLSSIVQGVLVP